MREIIEYNNNLYIVNSMIDYSKYGSDIKEKVYYVIPVDKLPNKIEFCFKDYIKIHLKGVDVELTKSNVNGRYKLLSTSIKDGELYYKYNLEKT